jgi:hypothetical protein
MTILILLHAGLSILIAIYFAGSTNDRHKQLLQSAR